VACQLNPRDSVMTNARRLASLPCGGTNCSAPLAHLNSGGERGLVIYVSDNESWIDTRTHGPLAAARPKRCASGRSSRPQSQAKMILHRHSAVGRPRRPAERADIINVGGFSDQVFSLIAAVAKGSARENHWVRQIEQIRL